MVNEILPLLAVAFVTLGVVLSVAKGIGNRPTGEKIKVGRITSSLIIGVLGAIGVSNLTASFISEQVSALGLVAFAIVYLLQGFGTDTGLSQLDK